MDANPSSTISASSLLTVVVSSRHLGACRHISKHPLKGGHLGTAVVASEVCHEAVFEVLQERIGTEETTGKVAGVEGVKDILVLTVPE